MKLVTDYQTFDALCGLLNTWVTDVTLDIETTGLEWWRQDARIVSCAITFTAGDTWVVPLSHSEAWHDDWKRVASTLFSACIRPGVVCHNAAFDLTWILHLTGRDLTGHLSWDTMAASHLIDETQRHGLKIRAVEDASVEPWDEPDFTDLERVDLTELAIYNAKDTEATLALYEYQLASMPGSLVELMDRVTLPAVRSIIHMQDRGLPVDRQKVKDLLVDADANIKAARQTLDHGIPFDLLQEFVPQVDTLFDPEPFIEGEGPVSWAPTSKFFKAYAERKWPVLETTETGAPSWDRHVLTRLARAGHEDAELLLEYRKAEKQKTGFLVPWLERLDQAGRLYPSYRIHGTNTGRLSSSNPNAQQIGKDLKVCFPGVVQGDFSQIEVRLMAHVAGDDNLRNVYREGRDVYRETGAHILQKSEYDITDRERFTMKAVVLGFLYGMSAFAFSNYARDVFDIDVSENEAHRFRNGFFKMYPDVAVYHELTRRKVRQQGYVESLTGRVRHLPEAKQNHPSLRGRAERQAINFLVQSLAADIMMMGLGELDKTYPYLPVVGTVHDSVLLDLPDPDFHLLEDVGKTLINPNTQQFGFDLSVPLVLEWSIGPSWGEVEEEVKVA